MNPMCKCIILIIWLSLMKYGYPIGLEGFPSGLQWSKCWELDDATVHSCSRRGHSNTCFSSTAVYMYHKTNRKICAFERRCSSGMMVDDKCDCVEHRDSCYHEKSCQVPKNVELPKHHCRIRLDIDLSPDVCSIGKPTEDCDTQAYNLDIPYVITSDGVVRPVSHLNIEWKPVMAKEDFFLSSNDLESRFDVNGDREYCDLVQSPECYAAMSGSKPYRGLLHYSTIPHLLIKNCSLPIYCYGIKSFVVYNHKLDRGPQACRSCSVTCDEKEIHLVLGVPGTKNIKICGKYSCKIHRSSDMVFTSDRDFHSLTTDDRVHITMHNSDHSVNWEQYAACPLKSVCEALDCWFCKDYFFNPSCFSTMAWWIIGLLLWLIVVLSGMTLASIKPLYKFMRGLLLLVLHAAMWIFRLCSFIVRSISNMLRLNKARMDEAMLSREAETTPKRPIGNKYKQSPVNVSRTDPELISLTSKRLSYGMSIYPASRLRACYLLLLLFPYARSLAPCSSSDIQTIGSESCSLVGDKLRCSAKTIMSIRLYSYDQTSCGFLRADDGTILGQVQITPLDISLRCEKESLYFTREVKMKFDTLSKCPGSGFCTKKWCESFSNSTDFKDWPKVKAPVRAFCKFGESCASHGCFYCGSPTCHPFRYYPSVQNPNIYEVFRCAKWSPVAKIMVSYHSGIESYETTVELIHGQRSMVSPKISITLELSINDHLPALVRDFIQQDQRMALIQAAPPGSPIAGQIGQLQCDSREAADELVRCSMAPNLCVCGVEFNGGSCDCSDVFLEPAFKGPDRLPLQIDNYYMESKTGRVYLKTPAYGNGKILADISGQVSAVKEGTHECQLSIDKLTGCYSCLKGALMKYKCVSSETFSTMMDCGSFSSIVSCDPSASIKEAYIRVDQQVGSFKCKVRCSTKEVAAAGVFQHISHPELSDASHIQLVPRQEGYQVGSLIGGFWSLLSITNLIYFLVLLFSGFLTLHLIKTMYARMLKKIF